MDSRVPNIVPNCQKLDYGSPVFPFLHFGHTRVNVYWSEDYCQDGKAETGDSYFMTVSAPIIKLTHWLYHGNNTLSEIIRVTIKLSTLISSSLPPHTLSSSAGPDSEGESRSVHGLPWIIPK